MNALLSHKFMEWEVQTTLKQMAPLKAPGPKGMPPLFYQNYQNLVGCDVTKTILSYLNTAILPHPINHTFITLIPKIKNHLSVNDFHPISLCNVLYKKISNVLANFLPNIILEHQSAFMKNRLISDNLIVAFETLNSMKNHKTGKTSYIAVKLDMSKAYDRVEQSFLEEIMRKLGFEERWIDLMMVFVKSVSYSILVNGEPKGLIRPSRGIRQGDPLSPFFFLLCTEGLHSPITKANNEGSIRGFSLRRRSPRLTHLLFADDNLLFCRANSHDCQKVLEILATYESVSGQQINRRRTFLFFSKSTSEEKKREIKEAFRILEILHYDKYLGLSSLMGKHKKASFDYIKERIWRKLQGCEEKLLSQAGREIPIKAVVQAIPTYRRSCFMHPRSLYHEIEALIPKF